MIGLLFCSLPSLWCTTLEVAKAGDIYQQKKYQIFTFEMYEEGNISNNVRSLMFPESQYVKYIQNTFCVEQTESLLHNYFFFCI